MCARRVPGCGDSVGADIIRPSFRFIPLAGAGPKPARRCISENGSLGIFRLRAGYIPGKESSRVGTKSVYSKRPGGHFSPAPLRLLSNRDPLRWAHDWVPMPGLRARAQGRSSDTLALAAGAEAS